MPGSRRDQADGVSLVMTTGLRAMFRAACWQCPMRMARRRLLRAAMVSLVAMAVGPVGFAVAAPPEVTITSPLNGSSINNQTPSFSGTTNAPIYEEFETFHTVTLQIYAGTTVDGQQPVQTLGTPLFFGGT